MSTSSFTIKNANIQFNNKRISKNLEVTIFEIYHTYIAFGVFEYAEQFLFILDNGIITIKYASIDDEILIKFLIDNEYAIIIKKEVHNYQLKITTKLMLNLI